jgi:hypothetical protein
VSGPVPNRVGGAGRNVRLALTGAVAARAALAGAAAVTARSAGAPWRRMNYAKRPVTLLGGPTLAASATATAVLGAPPGTRAAAAVVGAVSGLVGGYDDLAPASEQRRRSPPSSPAAPAASARSSTACSRPGWSPARRTC